jgi:YbbR domain-containing protein
MALRLRVLRRLPTLPPAEPTPTDPGPTPPWRRWLRIPRPRELRDSLRHNPGLKLVSLILAFLLWFSINVTERDAEIDINVPITVQRLAGDLIVTDQKPVKPVTVTVRGPRTILEGVDGRRTRLAVDMSNQGPGETKIDLTADMLRPELPRRVKAIRLEPNTVNLRVARLLQRQVPVKASLAGQPPDGYTLLADVMPAEVDVSGPARKVEALAEVTTEPINVRRLTETVTREVPLMWAGDFLRLSPDKVTVTLTVREVMMERHFGDVPVQVLHAGRFQARVRPARVDLVLHGPLRVLEGFKLTPEAVSVDAARLAPGQHEVEVAVSLPSALRLARIEPETLTLEIKEQEGR